MNKLKAVFWDVDGTLADTEMCGHRLAFNLAFKDFDLDWNWNESKYSGKINIREGVMRLINELSSFKVEQFIVTTSGRDSLEPFLKTSLSSHLNCFSGMVTYEDVSKHKPSPDAYKLALQLSKKSEVNCIAIEDSIIGVEAAKAANLNCLMTLPPWSSSNKYISKKANACVTSLGNMNKPSKIIYGKASISKLVDFEYLTALIN